jgi:hypothetical protein
MCLLFLWHGTYNDFEAGNIHYEVHYKGWALKSKMFWAQKRQRAQRVQFGPQKVSISGPISYNGPPNGYCQPQNH